MGPLADGRPDRSVDADGAADAATAGLNDPCDPPPCAQGLVCTGTGPLPYCRPACGGDAGCPDGQACGRPVGNLTVAPACLSVSQAKLYGDCSVDPCEPGLVCGSADEKVCFKVCLDPTTCGVGEDCIAGGATFSICHPRCTSDTDCPSTLLHCTGFGPYPDSHCTPTVPAGLGAVCKGDAYCKAGMRCGGSTATGGHCYAICPTGSCGAGESCFPMNEGEVCLIACTPLDSPVKCRSWEVCYADAPTAKAYCIWGAGSATTCSTSVPCITGKICVNGVCKAVCDATHPCPTGLNCLPLSYQGTPGPWSACI